MENELAPTTLNELAIPDSEHDDKQFLAVTKSGDYLSRLQLMISASDACKKNDFPANHWALIRDGNNRDVGASVDILVIAWRPKALDISGEEVITVYDPEHDEFKRIEADSNIANSSCMYGPEFLVWVPEAGEFATFFMGSKSSRRESPNLSAKLKQPATLSSKLIETKKYSWFAPIVLDCTTPLSPLPDQDSLAEQFNKFENPPEPEIEKAPEAAEGERER